MTTRRNFIGRSMAIGAMGAFGFPSIAKNQFEQGQLIGHGDFKYRVNASWGIQDPSRIPVRDCHEMVQDKNGRLILLTNHIKNNVIIYDPSGKVIDTWTVNASGAHGLTLVQEGGEEFLFITDEKENKVLKTDMKGEILMEINYPRMISDYEKSEQWKPTETAVNSKGEIYIADGYGLNYIVQYTAEGEYIRHWGGIGDGANQFDCCHGITIDNRSGKEELLITSRTNQEFKRFTLDGEYLETIPLPGCWICRPVIKGDNIYFAVIVTKSWFNYDGMIAVLDKYNRVVSLPGGSTPSFDGNELKEPVSDDVTFMNPHDVCVDNDLNLYVPQWYSGRTYPIKLERV